MQIFLGGTAGKTTWRKDIAIPILEAAGITYYNPQLGVGEWTSAHQQLEAKAKENAAVMLYAITADTRGVASLVEAAYQIGRGGKIALSVNDIEPETELDGEPLSRQEIKDLNRGRSYLREVAQQHGITIFEKVEEAVKHAVELVAK